MNARLYITLVSLAIGALACSAPESNPAIRCNADLSCEEPLVCYREYCVDPDGDFDPVLAPADAGVIGSDARVPTDAGISVVGDAAVITVPVTGTPSYTDVPGKTVVTEVVTPVATPVQTPVTPPASAPLSCVEQCKGTDKDACKDCFEEEYGDEPEKLCGEKKIDPAMTTICASVCGVNKWSVSCQQPSHAAGQAAGKHG